MLVFFPFFEWFSMIFSFPSCPWKSSNNCQIQCRIIFPGSNDTDKEAIVIIGTQQAVDAAKKVMEAKIKDSAV